MRSWVLLLLLASACSAAPEEALLPPGMTLPSAAHTAELSRSPVVVAVRGADVFFQGEPIGDWSALANEGNWLFPDLQTALQERRSRLAVKHDRMWILEYLFPAPQPESRALLAVDGDVRYRVVKKLLSFLLERGYVEIELAVRDSGGSVSRIAFPQGAAQGSHVELRWEVSSGWTLLGDPAASPVSKRGMEPGPQPAPTRIAEGLPETGDLPRALAEGRKHADEIVIVSPDDATFAQLCEKVDASISAGYRRISLAGTPL